MSITDAVILMPGKLREGEIPLFGRKSLQLNVNILIHLALTSVKIYLNPLNRFLYSDGGTPVIFLNCLLKWLRLLKPLSRQTSKTLKS